MVPSDGEFQLRTAALRATVLMKKSISDRGMYKEKKRTKSLLRWKEPQEPLEKSDEYKEQG